MRSGIPRAILFRLYHQLKSGLGISWTQRAAEWSEDAPGNLVWSLGADGCARLLPFRCRVVFAPTCSLSSSFVEAEIG